MKPHETVTLQEYKKALHRHLGHEPITSPVPGITLQIIALEAAKEPPRSKKKKQQQRNNQNERK